jgi:hypothetical protein
VLWLIVVLCIRNPVAFYRVLWLIVVLCIRNPVALYRVLWLTVVLCIRNPPGAIYNEPKYVMKETLFLCRSNVNALWQEPLLVLFSRHLRAFSEEPSMVLLALRPVR